VHLDDDGDAVEAHRELKSDAGVVDSVRDQFVDDEQGRLGRGPGDAPQEELVGERRRARVGVVKVGANAQPVPWSGGPRQCGRHKRD
jgi:hypothetical protein